MGFKPILRRAGLITDDWLFSRCSLRPLRFGNPWSVIRAQEDGVHGTPYGTNPKCECRNPKQIRRTEIEITETGLSFLRVLRVLRGWKSVVRDSWAVVREIASPRSQ